MPNELIVRGYYSQCYQDVLVDAFFRKKTGGIFVEAGAHDGITYSNTYFLESKRGWTGLCIEPHPETFIELARNRKCACLQFALGAVTDNSAAFAQVSGGTSGCSTLAANLDRPRLDILMKAHGGELTESKVQVRNPQEVFDEHGLTRIDYFSLDTDGNELEILEAIDWKRTEIGVLTVENTVNDHRHATAAAGLGLTFACRLAWDDVYVNCEMLAEFMRYMEKQS